MKRKCNPLTVLRLAMSVVGMTLLLAILKRIPAAREKNSSDHG